MRVELGLKFLPVAAVHRLGDQRAVLGRSRQRLGLLVVVVLQAMLEAAKESVGRRERFDALRREQAALADGAQSLARRSGAQARITPAADHLEKLHRELDLADAAGTHLDVVGLAPLHRRLEDARVQLAQRIEQAVVEVATVDERLHALRDAVGRTGDDPRLEPGIALPGPRVADEVVLQRGQRGDQRPAFAEGAQPHVHAEGLSIGGHLGEQGDQRAAREGEVLVVRDGSRPCRFTVGAVEEDEVHVGGDVELAAAELAEGDHDQLVARGRAVDRPGTLRGLGGRGAHALVGERRHRLEHLIQGGEAVQVAVGERDHDAIAQPSQAPGEVVAGRERRAHLLAADGSAAAPLEILDDFWPRPGHAPHVVRQPPGSLERRSEGGRGLLRH
jgi:hypothetical protein